MEAKRNYNLSAKLDVKNKDDTKSSNEFKAESKAKKNNINKTSTIVFTRKPTAIILNFFGTATHRNLVSSILLPFIKENVENYLKVNWKRKRVQKDIKRIKKEQKQRQNDFPMKINDNYDNENDFRKAIANYIQWAADKRTDHIGANKLMKHVCVFEDVPKALENWKHENIKIYGYATAKISAQKHFYKHTDHGNLLPFFDGFFDKSMGDKHSYETYISISKKLTVSTDKLLYITDLGKEAVAANKSGMKTFLIHRPGNKEIKQKYRKEFAVIQSFEEIEFSQTV
ncbi:enolase-phosphatase E1-like protein [Dinothrombium tinctorium]|uniref:Enolase-phosphatase E1-like protein n=1 Tax=Dinothrombium tinctorium TaxID=1965070 RepID=A0A443RNK3_9ACAR|nr:enolase-phosphatase E1-like protein [Dinothrombium tinctorium]